MVEQSLKMSNKSREKVNIKGVHYMENGNTWGKTTVFPQSKMGVFSAVLIGKL